jgi:hypothetical protein
VRHPAEDHDKSFVGIVERVIDHTLQSAEKTQRLERLKVDYNSRLSSEPKELKTELKEGI